MSFNSLNTSVVSNNRKFWKTVKPLFPNKRNYGNKIKLVENEEIICDDTKVAEEINNFLTPRRPLQISTKIRKL